MRIYALIIISLLCFVSCKSAKHTKIVTTKEESSKTVEVDSKHEVLTKTPEYKLANAIIDNALDYNGVRYKFGGSTRKGMDCSGLVYVSFKKENILLPRMSRDMAKKGQPIALNNVDKGDLLFFQTNKKRKAINHVGLVTKSENGNIEFIHATTGKGVITSSLTEIYWKAAFVEARRIL